MSWSLMVEQSLLSFKVSGQLKFLYPSFMNNLMASVMKFLMKDKVFDV
jgi:hypothetical protein